MPSPSGKHIWTVKVGEKGQIVIPKECRELFGIAPGDTLLVLGDDKRGIAIPPRSQFDYFTQILMRDQETEE